jgi:16S rRNA (guanine527-N7)-methyltransferase
VAAEADPRIGEWVTAAQIDEAVAGAGLEPLQPSQAGLFAHYLQLLLRWNIKMNLTAIREPSQIVRRHFLECIECAQALPDVKNLLDFGSGAGLPGIPISIVRPEIRVVLGESQGKKAAFLREAVRTLGLNSEVYDGRIEEMDSRQIFDAAALRAVDRMQDAARFALERVRDGGWLILFGTASTQKRLEAGLPGVIWEDPRSLFGLESGILLFGRKPCST